MTLVWFSVSNDFDRGYTLAKKGSGQYPLKGLHHKNAFEIEPRNPFRAYKIRVLCNHVKRYAFGSFNFFFARVSLKYTAHKTSTFCRFSSL